MLVDIAKARKEHKCKRVKWHLEWRRAKDSRQRSPLRNTINCVLWPIASSLLVDASNGASLCGELKLALSPKGDDRESGHGALKQLRLTLSLLTMAIRVNLSDMVAVVVE